MAVTTVGGMLPAFCTAYFGLNQSYVEYQYYSEEDDGTLGANDEAEQSLWLQEHHKKRRWKAKEEEVRLRMKTERELALKMKDKAKGKVENIFSSEAASRVLTSDLLAIMRETSTLGFTADAIDDNIYHWNVKLSDFDKSSALNAGMQQIQAAYNYNYIELELNFTIDLYPFYPPLVIVW